MRASSHNSCSNCGFKNYAKDPPLPGPQCMKSSPEWAAVLQGRVLQATRLDEWLRDACDLDDVAERTEIVGLFMDPRYVVDSPAKLFALNARDIDTILAPIALGARRLVTRTSSTWLAELDGGCDPWLQQCPGAPKRARLENVAPG
ncbi:hypothetical protein T484DRAFT_1749164 [Baffinella frigidus]|nr:hypothetical protein T484DRAFT_1749164 [Cryptophyta sp. CCMP2293]